MMATTHALAGSLLGAVALLVAPEHAPVAAAAGMAGGFFPDADLYAGHRRTLHYPVYFSAAAPAALVLAAVATSAATVALAAFLVAAALHSVMDAFGGGLELKPWQGTSDRAVYDHYNRRWVAPRRWVRYDGAPEDLLLAGVLAVPALLAFGDPIRTAVVAVLGVSAVYAIVRKPMVAVAEWLVRKTPDRLLDRVPERFLADLV